MGGRPDIGSLARAALEVAEDWGLQLEPPYALSRHSYVAAAGDAVLKLTPPEDDESDEEATRSSSGRARALCGCSVTTAPGGRC